MRLIDADELKRYAGTYDGTDAQVEAVEVKYIDNAPTVNIKPIANVTFDKEELEKIVNDRVVEPIKKGELVVKTIERPQGEWINEHSIDIGYKTAECSCCGERSRLISHDTGFGHKYEYYPFCHWCGADMRGGRE